MLSRKRLAVCLRLSLYVCVAREEDEDVILPPEADAGGASWGLVCLCLCGCWKTRPCLLFSTLSFCAVLCVYLCLCVCVYLNLDKAGEAISKEIVTSTPLIRRFISSANAASNSFQYHGHESSYLFLLVSPTFCPLISAPPPPPPPPYFFLRSAKARRK